MIKLQCVPVNKYSFNVVDEQGMLRGIIREFNEGMFACCAFAPGKMLEVYPTCEAALSAIKARFGGGDNDTGE